MSKLVGTGPEKTLPEAQKRYTKLRASPLFKDRSVITDDLVAVSMQKSKVVLDKPMQIGFAVLELSKLRMFNFYYNVMMPKYGPEKLTLLFTDTDSLTFFIETEDVYADMWS